MDNMDRIVMVNIPFRDVYTGKVYKAGKKITMSQERIAEIKEINKDLVSVVGYAEQKQEK